MAPDGYFSHVHTPSGTWALTEMHLPILLCCTGGALLYIILTEGVKAVDLLFAHLNNTAAMNAFTLQVCTGIVLGVQLCARGMHACACSACASS